MAALDYIDGAHEGNSARMERAVHPELNKVTVRKISDTGKSYLRRAGATRLVQIVGAKVAVLSKDKRNIQVEILDVQEGIITIHLSAAISLLQINVPYLLVGPVRKICCCGLSLLRSETSGRSTLESGRM